MDFFEKRRIENAYWGTNPNASRGHIRSVETLRAMEDVLNADPQGEIRAKLTPQKDGSLNFLIRRLNPMFTLESDIVHVEWFIPLNPKPGGIFDARILEGRLDSKIAPEVMPKLDFREISESLKLDYHIFEMMYAAHEMLTDLGRQRLGRAIPLMLENSHMSKDQKKFFEALAPEYFPNVPQSVPVAPEIVSLPDYVLS